MLVLPHLNLLLLRRLRKLWSHRIQGQFRKFRQRVFIKRENELCRARHPWYFCCLRGRGGKGDARCDVEECLEADFTDDFGGFAEVGAARKGGTCEEVFD